MSTAAHAGGRSDAGLLPPLYQRWVTELLPGPVPTEPRATCATCAMCDASAPRGDAEHFHPHAKCCTYLPILPNFLAGRILLDESADGAHGRATVLARLDAGPPSATPLGLGRTREYVLVLESMRVAYAARGLSHFGRADALRCPHYVLETDTCGIWRHRDSHCAVFFCKHERGAVGQAFWRGGLGALLEHVERMLARWAARELGASEEDWGPWRGRPQEMYAEASRRVDSLGWRDVVALGGADLEARVARALEAYERLRSFDLPSTVHVAEHAIVRRLPQAVRFASYFEHDPIDVPSHVAAALPRFDGRPTAVVLAELAREGVEIDAATVRRLVDFGLLVE